MNRIAGLMWFVVVLETIWLGEVSFFIKKWLIYAFFSLKPLPKRRFSSTLLSLSS